MLLEAVADSDLEHAMRELAAATVVHVITPKEGNVEAPVRFAEDVVLLRLALAKIAAEGGEGAPAFRERFAEDYGRLDEELELFRQVVRRRRRRLARQPLGDAAARPSTPRRRSRCSSTTKRSAPSSTTRGCSSATNYPITEKSLAGRVKQVQPFIDHLARKRDQDKKKITS